MAELKHESWISKSLSEKTTKIVIIVILVMLFMNPLFTLDIYVNDESSFKDGLSLLKEFEL